MTAALPDRLRLLVAGVSLALAVSIAAPALAQDAPFLRVETGVHEAAVNRMARLADGSLITVSDDKTARLWSPDRLEPRGRLLPPIGADDAGALYAVATSAKAIALGGRIRDAAGHYAVALYTQTPLAAAGLISALPTPVTALAFSPSGTALAIGLQAGGVRVVSLTTMRVVLEDEHYAKPVTWLTFDGRGRLMAVAEDGTLRVTEPDMSRATNVTLPPGAHPYGVTVSPDGRHIAVGDRQRAVVHLLDADRLRLERELEGGAHRAGSLNVVAFSPDGRSLFAGGSYVDETGTLYMRRWSLTGGPGADIPVARDLVSDLLPLADGVLFATAEPSVGRVGIDGQVTALLRSRHIDFRNAGRAGFRLSADGSRIQLPVGVSAGSAALPSAQAIVVDVRARAISAADDGAQTLAPPYATAAGLGVTEWQNSRSARLNGQLIPLQDAETIRAAAVQPSGVGAALGTDFFVRFVTRQGEIWRQPTGTPVWAVNASADGRFVVAGLADGTVRWYQAKDGQPVLTLFVDPPTGRFVIWTPEGFFDHDHRTDGQPDGSSLIGYRFNQASGRASDFVAIGQLYPRFFRPDMVGLAFRDDPAARRIVADQASLQGTAQLALAEGLPPAVTLLEACALGPDAPASGCAGQAPVRPEAVGAASTGTLRLRYRLSDPTGHVGTVVLSRNDAVMRPDTVIESVDDTTRVEQATFALGRGRTVVALTPVSNTGAVEAGTVGRVTLTVERVAAGRGTSATAESVAPKAERQPTTLYVLSVGVNQTGNPDWELSNPVNDARAVAAQMQVPAPSVYDTPDVVTLVDPDSTGAGILAALHRIAALAKPDDLVMIYLAGHGRTVDGRYYFAPHDLGARDPTLLQRVRSDYADPSVPDAEYDRAVDVLFRTEGLGQDQLLAALQTIQATRIALVLDTCYSATLADQDTVLRRDVNTTVTNRIGHASGRFVLSGSFAQAYDSTSDADLPTAADGHGLFTSFLLRALRGEADTDGSGRVDIYKLATFTKLHVEQESAHRPTVQEPAYYFAGNDFFALR